MDSITQSILLELLSFSASQNLKLYVVGGTLRDYLSRKPCTDIDLTGKNAADIAVRFARSLNFTYVSLDNTPGRKTVRVILEQNKHFDFTDLQGRNIEEDLSQRDFSINAMGHPLSDFLSGRKSIIDPLNGQFDLKSKIVRALQGPTFQSDPLRMLRAFRFAATLGFDIDEETLSKISRHKSLLVESAKERIWNELTLFFRSQQTLALLRIMKKCGILDELFPVSDAVWSNMLIQYQKLEGLLNGPEAFFTEYREELSLNRYKNNEYLSKVSVLLNGVKQSSNAESASPENPFPVFQISEELNLPASNAEIKFIEQTLYGARCLVDLYSKHNNNMDAPIFYELVKNIGEGLPSSVILFVAGFNNNDGQVKHFCNQILKFYFLKFLPVVEKQPLLNGDGIINRFELSPSPLFGKILDAVQKAHVLGEIATHDEALALAGNIIQSQTTDSE